MSAPAAGEWELDPDIASCRVRRAGGPNKGDGVAQAVNPAWARLIAAAPDLLEACRIARKCLIDLAPYPPEVSEGVVAIVGMVGDSIAKAEGGGGVKTPIAITGAWLRRIGDRAELLIEVDGHWRLACWECLDSNFSHIVEPLGIEVAPVVKFIDPGAEREETQA